MKAVVYTKYGPPDVLHLEDVEKPTPMDNEVLVQIRAASVNAKDWRLLRADPFLIRLMYGGLFKPKHQILGADIAGRVETVGSSVTELRPGDEVYGDVGECGLGGFAEYVSAPEDVLAKKPANISFEEAAAVPMAAVSALQALRDDGEIQPGQKVLINGASGGVGTFAVQIAKALGAEVTGVCSKRNVEMVRSIGADHVIDYTEENFTQGEERYDLILDNVANHSLRECRGVLAPGGVHIPNSSNGGIGFIINAFAQSALVNQQGRPYFAVPANQDLVDLKEMIEAGKVTPVVDRTYQLSETPDAFRYLEDVHAQGKVGISMASA